MATLAQARRSRFSFSRLGAALVLIVLALVAVYPFVWMVLSSLRERNTIFTGPFIPERFVFDAYPAAWQQTNFGLHFVNTLIVAFFALAGIFFLSTTAGYAFAKLNFPFKRLIYILLLSTMAMPATSLIIPLYLQVRNLGLNDSMPGLILVYVGSMTPFSIFLMRSFFEVLPRELVEASRIDGASEWGTFYRIMLPLVKPGIGTMIILQFLAIWNEFLYAVVLVQKDAIKTLTPVIFNLVGQFNTNWTSLTAALTMAIIPIIIVYVNMQKQFVSGLTQGAVKG